MTFISKVAFVLFVVSPLILSCQHGKPPLEDKQAAVEEGYSMFTKEVNLLVSDSGMTQYHLEAKSWYIYDQGEDSRWFFPEGFHAEKIDTLMHPQATLEADTAYYYTQQSRWMFLGNVRVKNLAGDTFIAKSLSWDSDSRMVSSDDSVTVHSEDRILSGTSFRATQDFSRYLFLNNQGEVNIDEEELEANPEESMPEDSQDSATATSNPKADTASPTIPPLADLKEASSVSAFFYRVRSFLPSQYFLSS